MRADSLSVADALAGRSVLITGATGYVGSLVLEQLLRVCPGVDRVFVLVREKQGRAPPERLQRLLDGGLFHLLWDRPGVLEKVAVVEGDILRPGCGLSEADRRRLAGCSVVVHAAASVCFTSPVRESLQHNYHATSEVLALAEALPQLRAFVHVSTAFVNGHQPQGSRVEERLYPAVDERQQPIQHADFVRRLDALPAAQAEALAAALAFPNPYCLSKWLAERLVAERHAAGLPAVLVRPAIIGAVAGTPYPGYVGNRTGTTGAALAIGTGIWTFSRHRPGSVMDVVPGDTVSSTILLAAAAAVQDGRRQQSPPPILHVGTSSSSAPLVTGRFYQEVRGYFSDYPAPHSFSPTGCLPERMRVVRHAAVAALLDALSALKFGAVAALLWLCGRGKAARSLLGAWTAVRTFNHPRLDFDLRFDTSSTAALAARLPAAERQAVRPLWDSASWAAEEQQQQRQHLQAERATAPGQTADADDSWVDLGPRNSSKPAPTCSPAASTDNAAVSTADADAAQSPAHPQHADAAAAGKLGWRRYLRMYVAGAAALRLRQPPATGAAADTGFVLIPARDPNKEVHAST